MRRRGGAGVFSGASETRAAVDIGACMLTAARVSLLAKVTTSAVGAARIAAVACRTIPIVRFALLYTPADILLVAHVAPASGGTASEFGAALVCGRAVICGGAS